MLSDCFIPCSPYLDVREISGHLTVPASGLDPRIINLPRLREIGIFLCLGLSGLSSLSGLPILSGLLLYP